MSVIQSIHLCFAVITDKLLEEQETTRKKEEFVAHLKSKSSKTNTNVQDLKMSQTRYVKSCHAALLRDFKERYV